jgi:preprotein translocase subunit SecG
MVAKLVGGLKKAFVALDVFFLVLFITLSLLETYTSGKYVKPS